MKFEQNDWVWAHETKTIIFKTWPTFWLLCAGGKKTAEFRVLNAAESKRLERSDVTAIKLVSTTTGNTIQSKLLWHGKVGEFLGLTAWMFCWDPEDMG